MLLQLPQRPLLRLMVCLLAITMPLLMTLADNVAIPNLIQNASSKIYAEFMILHGEYLMHFVYTLLIFF
jgi:hypothetical protein